ncbi:YmdB family metallophosphoesterase [bacterium]|nr:YmdB family metallophosphoesterase [bacterium]
MNNSFKILFFGDIVGKIGRKAVCDYLSRNKNDVTFTVANVENASHGFGLTEKNYNELLNAGFDCFTSGNHIWDKKDIFKYIKTADKLVRPLNYSKKAARGQGSAVFDFNDVKIGVINVLGQTFMQTIESPWEITKKEIKKIKKVTPYVIVDFHAEATAEKVCFGRYCSELGATAFFGTHTHVQTADDKIINDMAYITDAGFCGAYDSVIGIDYESSLKRLSTGLPERFDVPETSVAQINAVEAEFCDGKAIGIKRINFVKDLSEVENES